MAEDIVCDRVNKIESLEKQKSPDLFTERIVKKTKSINDTLHKIKLSFFSYKPPLQSKHSSDISTLNENVKHFSQLYVASQKKEEIIVTWVTFFLMKTPVYNLL